MTNGSPPNLKRILVLSNRYYPYYKGGYSLSCKSITDELIERGYDVCVLTSKWQVTGGQTDSSVYRLLNIREPASSHPFYRRWQHLCWGYTSRLDYRIARQVMESLVPDIVYVWNMGHISLGPLAAAQDMKFPLVFDLGDYWLLRRYQELDLEPDRRKKRYRLFIHGLKRFDPLEFPHLLTHSRVLKQRYVEAGFPSEHISIIPRGLQSHFIQETPPLASQRSVVELLCAGRLTEAKGIHLAIQAVAMLNREMVSELGHPAHLDIIGDADSLYMHNLEKLVASLEMQQYIHFVAKLPQRELLERYKRYDAVLIPSIWLEPFGRITIEAMAQGTCVIASDRGGPAEIITHRQDGLLVKPEDPAAMAQAVVNLVQDRDLTNHIRHAAIATVRERYSLDKVGDQVETYLKAALADHHRRNQEKQTICAS